MNWIKNLNLRSKILLIVGLACTLCAVVSISGFVYFNKKELELGITNKERTIHTQLSAATEFVARQGGLTSVIQKFSSKYSSADQMNEQEKHEVLNQVPIYASLVIGKKNAEVDHYDFRVFSDEPRRKENLATSQELEIFKKFNADPALNELTVNDGKKITMYRPVRLSEAQGCLSCHGSPSSSPWKNGTDILGFKMEDWKDGKLHGVFAISQDMAAVAATSSQGSFIAPEGWLILAILLGALVAIIFAAFFMSAPIRFLNQLASKISDATGKVKLYSQEVASSSHGLSSAVTQQAASMAETAASLEEISAMVSKASDSANSTAASSSESQAKAEEGRIAVDQMLNSMNEISAANEAIMRQVDHSNQQMSEVVRLIQDIGTKTKVINEIVFQTKLLSFNASVEAARAGEHGKGFAVVAEEVGNLAQMSGNAAKEISEMLSGSISKVEEIVKSSKAEVDLLVQQGKEKVDSGVIVAHQCSEVLNDIVSNISKVSVLAQEISQASREQEQGIGEINKAMNQLDSVTQQNTSISEQNSNSASELSQQADSLESAVEGLVNTVRGKAS